jgi:ketosteroid isomerase-like protein
MTRFEAFAALFNEGRLKDALGEVAEGYTYTDPIFGTVRGKDAHVTVMQQVLDAYPDRTIHVVSAWGTGDLEFAEYRWQGTPTAGGDRVNAEWAVVIEYRQDRMLRQRHYRG